MKQVFEEKSHFFDLPKDAKQLFIAVSGGLDSTVLAHVILNIWKNKDKSGHDLFKNISKIQILHFNHQLRGKESDDDAEFVEKLADRFKVPAIIKKLKFSEKSQAKYREARQSFFQKLLEDNPHSYIVLAHHQDDLAETIFMRVIRGTGVNGLLPMKRVSGKIYRPFLNISRSQIQSYARQMKISWREDSSNQQNQYERNWVRNEVFPMLEKRRPRFQERLVHLANDVHSIAKKTAAKSPAPIPILKTDFAKIFLLKDLKALSDAALSKLFAIERKHIALLRSSMSKNSTKLSLPGGEVHISYGFLFFGDFEKFQKNFTLKKNKNTYQSVFGNWGVIGEAQSLEARIGGESGKIKKQLMEAKVPSFLRQTIPVLKSETKNVLLLPKKINESYEWQFDRFQVHYVPSVLAKSIIESR